MPLQSTEPTTPYYGSESLRQRADAPAGASPGTPGQDSGSPYAFSTPPPLSNLKGEPTLLGTGQSYNTLQEEVAAGGAH